MDSFAWKEGLQVLSMILFGIVREQAGSWGCKGLESFAIVAGISVDSSVRVCMGIEIAKRVAVSSNVRMCRWSRVEVGVMGPTVSVDRTSAGW